MRVIIHTGKGGVGKTSISAATGLELARRGYRTLIMSVDQAHSLSDSFDLGRNLIDSEAGLAIPVCERLWIQEINVQHEIVSHWDSFYTYVAALLSNAGIEQMVAEEMAIFPGMEEISALLNLTRYAREDAFDVVVIDCAPTAEALRFVTVPTTMEWYMKKIFPLERRTLRLFGPILRRLRKISLPPKQYFDNIEQLYSQLRGVNKLLANSKITTVRLVTNPEKVVLRETQRAFSYLCLCGLTIDAVIINRVLPSEVTDDFFARWKATQKRWIENLDEFFAPVPTWQVRLFPNEMLGIERLNSLSRALYENRDPSQRFLHCAPFRFRKVAEKYQLHLLLPFVSNDQVLLHKQGDELIVQVGSIKRHIALPARLMQYDALEAKVESRELIVVLGKGET